MKLIFSILFIQVSLFGIGQSNLISEWKLKSERKGVRQFISYANRIEMNSLFSVTSLKIDTIQISLTDTCGTVKHSNLLYWPVQPQVWGQYEIRLLRLPNKKYVLTCLRGGSRQKAMIWCLNENLSINNVFQFQGKGRPFTGGEATTYKPQVSISRIKNNEVIFQVNRLQSSDGNAYDWWHTELVNLNLETGQAVDISLLKKAGKDPMQVTSIHQLDNGSFVFSGFNKTDSRVIFIALMDKDYSVTSYQELELKIQPDSSEYSEIKPYAIYLLPNNKIVIWSYRNTVNMGARTSEIFYTILGSDLKVEQCEMINMNSLIEKTSTLVQTNNQIIHFLSFYGDEAPLAIYHNKSGGIRYSRAKWWNSMLPDLSYNGFQSFFWDYNDSDGTGVIVNVPFQHSSNGCKSFSPYSPITSSVSVKVNLRDTDELLADVSEYSLNFPFEEQGDIPILNWQKTERCPNLITTTLPAFDHLACIDSPVTITARSVGQKFMWNIGDTTRTISGKTHEQYYCTIANGYCEIVDTQNVIKIDSFNVEISNDTTICSNASALLSVSGSGASMRFEWITSKLDTLQGSTIVAKDSGLYKVKVAGQGCETFDSARVSFFKMPNADAGIDGEICRNDTFLLTGEGGVEYEWTPAEFLDSAFKSETNAFPPNSQVYRLVVTSKDGCHDTDFTLLSVNNNPQIFFESLKKEFSFIENKIQLSNPIDSNYRFQWFVNNTYSSSSRNFEFEFPDTGYFTIMLLAQTDKGCLDSFKRKLYVSPFPIIHFTNAFTPNDDGINDVFAPTTLFIDSYEMSIYSRWGQIVWKSNSRTQFPSWDGTTDHSIELVPVGTYLYMISVSSKYSDQSQMYSGKVHLIR